MWVLRKIAILGIKHGILNLKKASFYQTLLSSSQIEILVCLLQGWGCGTFNFRPDHL